MKDRNYLDYEVEDKIPESLTQPEPNLASNVSGGSTARICNLHRAPLECAQVGTAAVPVFVAA